MSTLPQIGDIRFGGEDVKVFYMALCKDCDTAMPFEDVGRRATWTIVHRGTGHVVSFATDVRPAPGTVPVMRGASSSLRN